VIAMGLHKEAFKLMLHENCFRPVGGRVLLVGKSTVAMEASVVDSLLGSFGLPRCSSDLKLNDSQTKASSGKFWIDDVELLQTVFPQITHIDIADVSDYEGANLIVDMNQPIDKGFIPRYDFIFDSSVLDNVWNPSQMLINLSHLLSPGGRLLLHNVASFFPGALCSMHPEWFYAFFAINDEFADAKVYLFVEGEESPPFLSTGHVGALWQYSPLYNSLPDWKSRLSDASRSIKGIAHTLVLAEMGPREFDNARIPTNLQYVKSSGALDWASMGSRFERYPRPVVSSESKELDQKVHNLIDLPHFSGNYRLCDPLY